MSCKNMHMYIGTYVQYIRMYMYGCDRDINNKAIRKLCRKVIGKQNSSLEKQLLSVPTTWHWVGRQ